MWILSESTRRVVLECERELATNFSESAITIIGRQGQRLGLTSTEMNELLDHERGWQEVT